MSIKPLETQIHKSLKDKPDLATAGMVYYDDKLMMSSHHMV